MSHSEAITAHVKPSHVPPITTQAGGNGSDPDRRVPRWPESAGVGPGEHTEASACGKRPGPTPIERVQAECPTLPLAHQKIVRQRETLASLTRKVEELGAQLGQATHELIGYQCGDPVAAERIAFLEAELAEARLAADRWRKQATDAEQELASDREWYEGEFASARLTASEALDKRDAVMADRDQWVERVKALEAKLASVREVVR